MFHIEDWSNPMLKAEGFVAAHCEGCSTYASIEEGADDIFSLMCRFFGWPSNDPTPLAIYADTAMNPPFYYTEYTQELCAALGVDVPAEKFGAHRFKSVVPDPVPDP
jgi:hypothetical protein